VTVGQGHKAGSAKGLQEMPGYRICRVDTGSAHEVIAVKDGRADRQGKDPLVSAGVRRTEDAERAQTCYPIRAVKNYSRGEILKPKRSEMRILTTPKGLWGQALDTLCPDTLSLN